jgi:protein transport protein SEC20
VLILSAFVFFVLVVLFIVKQRVLDKGVRIAFWWTRFLPDFSGDEALLAHGMEKATDVFEVVQNSASAVSAIVTSVTLTMASASLSTPSSSLATEGHHDHGVQSSTDKSDLEMAFSQATSPSASTLEPESTILGITTHDDTTRRTSGYHTRAVDEL